MKKKKTYKSSISKIASQLGSLGGKENLRKHGKEHFKKMAIKKWQIWRENNKPK